MREDPGDDTADLFKISNSTFLHFYRMDIQGIFQKEIMSNRISTERRGGGETHRLVLKGELPAFSVVFDFNLSWAT